MADNLTFHLKYTESKRILYGSGFQYEANLICAYKTFVKFPTSKISNNSVLNMYVVYGPLYTMYSPGNFPIKNYL